MYDELEGLVDWAAREEQETSFFVEALSHAARDFTWYLRDNLQSVLTNEWDQLRDLAYEGSTDFIPALHAFGLPKAEWSPSDMHGTMIAIAEKVRDERAQDAGRGGRERIPSRRRKSRPSCSPKRKTKSRRFSASSSPAVGAASWTCWNSLPAAAHSFSAASAKKS